jgi:hypothetical protein
MSLYGDAIAAIRSIILIEDRVQAQSRKVEKLGDEVVALRERVVRLEAVIEVLLQTRAVAPSRPSRGTSAITDERG